MKKLTTIEFINKANLIHNNKYDYSETKYINSNTKVIIICPVHNEFLQRPADHLAGYGCKMCGIETQKSKVSISWDELLLRFTKKHGDKYLYNKDSYINFSQKLEITCPSHGKYFQNPSYHLKGFGCASCAKESEKLTLQNFINKANKVHNNKYDYSKSIYINFSSKINIICPIHGEFNQTVSSHLKGSACRKCVNFISHKEQDLNTFLNTFNLKTENIRPKWLKSYINKNLLELDIYISKLNLAIEYNGTYWHSNEILKSKGYDENYHKFKYDKCKENGINLIHIFEFENLNEWKRKLKMYIENPDNYVISFKNEKRIIKVYNSFYTIYGKSDVEYKTST